MAENIDDVFRDWNVQGDPASGEYEPEKSRIRALLWQIEASGGQSVTRNTLAQLNAVTPPTENYGGVVLNDPDPANNGYYARVSGAWVRGRGFPDTFAEGVLSGSGTAQVAAFGAGVNPADIEIFWSRVATENTGPMTLNGKPVVSVAGNPLVAGEWSGVVLYVDEGPNWRLLIDVNAAQIASQAASDAADSANRAETWTPEYAADTLAQTQSLRDETSELRDEAQDEADRSISGAERSEAALSTVSDLTKDLLVAETLTQLNTTPGTSVGQPGRVIDDGSNTGEYRWSGSAWVRIGDYIHVGYFERSATASADWNVITVSGVYRTPLGSPATGAPTTNINMSVEHHESVGGRAWQRARQADPLTVRTWQRFRGTGGIWGEWVESLSTQNTAEVLPAATLALDWNAIDKSGFYRGSGNVGETIGAPTANAYMTVFHLQGQVNAAMQIASQSSSAVSAGRWMRSRSATTGEWGEWAEILTTQQSLTLAGVEPGTSFRDGGFVRVARNESQFYGQTAASVYNNSASELHGHYDQMIADFPDYVTKELLGQDNFGNDIFEYTFAAPPLRGANQTVADKAHPKIVVVNAVHPDEKYSIVGNLCFFDDLCRNWQQDERLADLRWGAKIVLLAVANPSGVNANTRLNAAGVNIGRNLSYDWDNNTSPDKGPAPLSEPESQYIADLAVRHPEACAFIDHHGHAGQHLTWFGARLDKAFTIAKHTARINGAWSRRFVPGLYDDNSITAVTSTTIGGPPCEWAEVYGKNAFLLESAETTSWSGLSRRDNHRVIVESMLCLIHENWRRESETRGYVS